MPDKTKKDLAKYLADYIMLEVTKYHEPLKGVDLIVSPVLTAWIMEGIGLFERVEKVEVEIKGIRK